MNKNVNNNNNNNNVNALTITKSDNIVYDLNGKATAPLTLDNAFSALKSIDRVVNKSDLTRIAIMSTILEACADKKTLASMKKTLVSEYGFKSTNVIDKYYKVATTFLTVDKTSILSAHKTDVTALADTVDIDGNTYEISVDTSCVTGWVDKYGFPFSLAQMQEFLWLKDDLGNIDVDTLTELINEGKIKASMSASGKNGIRDTINALKPTKNDDSNDDSNNDSNNDKDNDNDNAPITVQYEPNSDKSKAVAIQTIINSMPDEFVKQPMVAPFVEYLAEYIKNTK